MITLSWHHSTLDSLSNQYRRLSSTWSSISRRWLKSLACEFWCSHQVLLIHVQVMLVRISGGIHIAFKSHWRFHASPLERIWHCLSRYNLIRQINVKLCMFKWWRLSGFHEGYTLLFSVRCLTFSQYPCTPLTAFACRLGRARELSLTLRNGGNPHRSREPIMHCDTRQS